jgi:hypothetical protein
LKGQSPKPALWKKDARWVALVDNHKTTVSYLKNSSTENERILYASQLRSIESHMKTLKQELRGNDVEA